MLHELHEERYFDVFEFNAVSTLWACFMCNHPEKVSGLLQDGLPEIAVSVWWMGEVGVVYRVLERSGRGSMGI